MKAKYAFPAIAAVTVAITIVATQNLTSESKTELSGKTSAIAYHDTWRKLWEDHITWTRMVIIGVFDSLPGVTAYQTRLLQNADDMEAALEPYYGDDAEELGDLIRDHLSIAVEILTAAKNGDTAAQQDATDRWYQNGDQIAQFMDQINPQDWSVTESERMWEEHLDATLAEAVAHLTNDFEGDVAAYDTVHNLALEMADFFSDGVIRQFPNEFSSRNCIRRN